MRLENANLCLEALVAIEIAFSAEVFSLNTATQSLRYSAIPYLTLIRSIFSSIGSAAIMRNIAVPKPWTRSIGRPVM